MQKYIPIDMDIKRNKKRAKISIWIGSILCSGSLLFFLVWLIMTLVLGSPQQFGPMTFLPLMAITIFVLVPVCLAGLLLITYGVVLKQKNT